LDRKDALGYYLLLVAGAWVLFPSELFLTRQLNSAYGVWVVELTSALAIIASGIGVFIYAVWPPRPSSSIQEVRPPRTMPVVLNAEKLRALSPIHTMIMAIARVSPREASFGPGAGDGIGRFVRYDTPNLNLDKVRFVFSEYAHVLGDHHLKEWLKFDEEIRGYADRGGFWVGKREWKWFDELEKEYRETVGANLPQTTPEIDVKQQEFDAEDVGPPLPLESIASFMGVPNFEEILRDWLTKKLPGFCNVQVKSLEELHLKSQDWSEARGIVQDSDLAFYHFALRLSSKGKIDKNKSYVKQ